MHIFHYLYLNHFLNKEAEHVDGFAKECAIVTHSRLKTGSRWTEHLFLILIQGLKKKL